jgi:hypothetical protein
MAETEEGGVRINLPPDVVEVITLHAPGAIPGIPGESHGPGTFLIDRVARTITEIPLGPLVPVTITGTDANGESVTETVYVRGPLPTLEAQTETPST